MPCPGHSPTIDSDTGKGHDGGREPRKRLGPLVACTSPFADLGFWPEYRAEAVATDGSMLRS